VIIANQNLQAELILPKELYEIIKDDFLKKCEAPVYGRVILPLQALLEGEFFNEFIKKGKSVVLSFFHSNFLIKS
jgi:ribonuclease P/MRP protein subunit RPP40